MKMKLGLGKMMSPGLGCGKGRLGGKNMGSLYLTHSPSQHGLTACVPVRKQISQWIQEDRCKGYSALFCSDTRDASTKVNASLSGWSCSYIRDALHFRNKLGKAIITYKQRWWFHWSKFSGQEHWMLKDHHEGQKERLSGRTRRPSFLTKETFRGRIENLTLHK